MPPARAVRSRPSASSVMVLGPLLGSRSLTALAAACARGGLGTSAEGGRRRGRANSGRAPGAGAGWVPGSGRTS